MTFSYFLLSGYVVDMAEIVPWPANNNKNFMVILSL